MFSGPVMAETQQGAGLWQRSRYAIQGCGFTEIQSASEVEFVLFFPLSMDCPPTVINAISAALTDDEAAAARCLAVITHLHLHTS